MIFTTYIRRIYMSLGQLTWTAVGLVLVGHMALSYVLFAIAGESDLTSSWVDFVYYYMVTATTVGYGDISPSGAFGRLAASFFVLPGGIAIFTAVLGKLLTGVSTFWRNRMRGLGDYSDRKGHIVVLGWQEGSTLQTLRLIAAERRPTEPVSVLVAKDLPENPAGDAADFVRTERLSDSEALERAGISGARAAIVRGANDDETLAAALIVEDHCPTIHIVAYFTDDRTAQSLRLRHPRIEAVASLSEELLSRSARDPGSSVIAARLLSFATDDTALSIEVPTLDRPISYGDAFLGLKRLHGVTVVGLAHEGTTDLNCDDSLPIRGGETVFYISTRRLDPSSIQWSGLGGAR